MKTQHLSLEDGVIEFLDDKIIITDKCRSRKIGRWVILLSWFLYSITTAIRGFMERDQGFFIFGVILSSIWLFAFIKETFTRIKATKVFDNQIEIKDIIKITFKSYRFGYLLKGRIDLKNNSFREIWCSPNELSDSEFEKLLNERGIEVLQNK